MKVKGHVKVMHPRSGALRTVKLRASPVLEPQELSSLLLGSYGLSKPWMYFSGRFSFTKGLCNVHTTLSKYFAYEHVLVDKVYQNVYNYSQSTLISMLIGIFLINTAVQFSAQQQGTISSHLLGAMSNV